MRFTYLLPLLGLASAAPTESDYPIPLNKRDTVPSRRAAVPTVPTTSVNLTNCVVTLRGDPGWYEVVDTTYYYQQGNLYIVEGIPSPGTKNGANPYEFSFQLGTVVSFSTNEYVKGLPYKLGPVNKDYAKVNVLQNGRISATVDYANLGYPSLGLNAPLTFWAKVSTGQDSSGKIVYGPLSPFPVSGAGTSGMWVTVSDKGVLDGLIGVDSITYSKARLVARLSGACFTTVVKIPVAS
ncbi:hypothetical protein F53441_3694 [Fusarium austroafricanum]|uniref:Uncharacterized protein n=1 Tax=Fusarium austroafricanum TaxID=2364996 RepID=A0A8H4KLX6_9HYPO|nr:hypothetical protein F53441_3694 [Fusarium austroafricanum]